MCRHEHELCKHDLRGLSKHEVNQHYFEFIRNATKKEREANGFGKHSVGVYKCRICGDISFHIKQSFKNYLKVCRNNCNGIRRVCCTVIGYNDLATMHPHKVKYFLNIEDAYTHTYASEDKVDLVCPDCGHIKRVTIKDFVKYGFSCDFCSDGIPYPEKVMALVLKALGINFKKQHEFNKYGKYYYDFYLIDYNIIIEVHGGQHYEEMNRPSSWKSYEDEHENDLVKYDIAVLNRFEYNKNYLVINAKYSNIDYIKQSIYNCSFFQQFNLDNIDWQDIDIKAQKSIRIEICEYWKEQKEINKDLTTLDVAKEFKTNKSVICRYLNWGNKNGLCVYNGEEESKASKRRQSEFVYLVKPNGAKWFDEPMSQNAISIATGISHYALRNIRNKKQPLKYNGQAKYDSKYIGSYVVDADEWDSQHN